MKPSSYCPGFPSSRKIDNERQYSDSSCRPPVSVPGGRNSRRLEPARDLHVSTLGSNVPQKGGSQVGPTRKEIGKVYDYPKLGVESWALLCDPRLYLVKILFSQVLLPVIDLF